MAVIQDNEKRFEEDIETYLLETEHDENTLLVLEYRSSINDYTVYKR